MTDHLRYELDLCHANIDTNDPTFLHSVKYITLWEQHDEGFWDGVLG